MRKAQILLKISIMISMSFLQAGRKQESSVYKEKNVLSKRIEGNCRVED